MWLMMVVGVFFAWAMDRRNMDAEIERSSRSIHDVEQKQLIEIERLEREIDQLRREGVRRKYAEKGFLVYPF